ncbi:Ubiquinone biosynthesis O-methyltransferase [Nocardioides dokdonensis FR1436]|uniref:Ubiquinone biosynthesis O-methyltransferase n=1 Tax=Nocardioides dokdonensis FR1436 TaxID=1300347 RepID=A0A1A9GLI6_9ACTN|nr:methyltransferase [Nocardioides dokdonensis]ANH39134.1 Ubiquinone biosynthesis O-methyltransferase [Nocardioides dokdonensis FR1436]
MRPSERPERPSERRAAARTAVVWDALRPVLEQPGAAPLDVLDIGGGTGGFAVRVAELGHRVTVVDPSPDALASLGRRARECGVEVTGVQGEVSTLLDVAGADSADVVLCHGVLEHVGDPASALGVLREAVRPGGTLSLLVAQRHAAVLARAMAGHFGQARALLDPVDPTVDPGRAGHRYTSDELVALLAAADLHIEQVHGVRVFADLVPAALLDLEPGATAALVELEQAVSTRPEYLPLATQLHVLAR